MKSEQAVLPNPCLEEEEGWLFFRVAELYPPKVEDPF
jgi:hypothetical protein